MRIQNYLENSPLFALNDCQNRINPLVGNLLKDEEVNLFQALILTALYFEGAQQVTPSTLVKTFGTSKGHISQALSTLEYKGLILRNIDDQDARKYALKLTPNGQKLVTRLINKLTFLQTKLEEKMGAANLKILIEQLNTMKKIVEQISYSPDSFQLIFEEQDQ